VKRTNEGSWSQSITERRRSRLVPSVFIFMNAYSWL
jgi:hypothetical protein